MSKNTVTFALNGEVTLALFAQAIQAFEGLIGGLQRSIAKNARIEWVVSDLAPGSAQATFEGRGEAPLIEKVITAYEDTGEKMRCGRWNNINPEVLPHARALIGTIDGKIRSVRLETAAWDTEITSSASPPQGAGAQLAPEGQALQAPLALGAVRGRVQSITNRHQLRFTLYDLNHDRPVNCYLREGMEENMRDAWGKLAIVEGRVRRDPTTNEPTTVRDVSVVRILRESRGTWRDAVGVLKWKRGDPLPEDLIRRSRDS